MVMVKSVATPPTNGWPVLFMSWHACELEDNVAVLPSPESAHDALDTVAHAHCLLGQASRAASNQSQPAVSPVLAGRVVLAPAPPPPPPPPLLPALGEGLAALRLGARERLEARLGCPVSAACSKKAAARSFCAPRAGQCGSSWSSTMRIVGSHARESCCAEVPG